MKKIISIILCVILVASVFSVSYSAFALELTTQSVKGITPYNVKSVDLLETRAIKNPGGLSEYLHQKMLSFNEQIDVSTYQIPNSEEGHSIIKSILYNEHPDCFHIEHQYRYSYYTGYVSDLFLTYTYTQEQFSAISAEIDVKANYLLRGLDSVTLSQAEKALLVHDRLISWCEYDYENYLSHSVPKESFTIVGAINDQIAVCSGYAMAYSYLVDALGLECSYIGSAANSHSWNMVTVDGDKYFVDCSNDDPVWDIYGRVNHGNFLLSTQAFSALPNHEIIDYDTSPNNTKYDNYFWKNVQAEFQYVNGKFYYADKDDKQIKVIENGTTSNLIGLENWVLKRNHFSTVYTDPLTRLSSDDDYLYYSTHEGIRSYNFSTGEDKNHFAPNFPDAGGGNNFLPIGFKKTQCVLRIDINNDPNASRTSRANYGISVESHNDSPYSKDALTHWKTCSRCGLTYGKTGHVFENYVVTKPATHTSDEERTGTCVCGQTDTKVIPGTMLCGTVTIGDGRTSAKYDYKTPVKFIAYTTEVDRNNFTWYINGSRQNVEGNTIVINAPTSSYKIMCETVDRYGNLIRSKEVSVTIKNGFFDKIIYFFRNLFGLVREKSF